MLLSVSFPLALSKDNWSREQASAPFYPELNSLIRIDGSVREESTELVIAKLGST